MGASTARKVQLEDHDETISREAKRRHGLALLMAAIWNRHNPSDDEGSPDGELTRSKGYLADIW